jgi:metal-responsive CopG/Arc/MetJ family transcriptional regulator
MSFSLPPEIAKELEAMAKKRGMTRSQLLREMIKVFRTYVEEAEFEELQRYGEKRARELNLYSEEDIERLIYEARST